MIERPLSTAALASCQYAKITDLKHNTVLGIVAFQRGFQSPHPVLHIPAVRHRPVWHREGLVSTGVKPSSERTKTAASEGISRRTLRTSCGRIHAQLRRR